MPLQAAELGLVLPKSGHSCRDLGYHIPIDPMLSRSKIENQHSPRRARTHAGHLWIAYPPLPRPYKKLSRTIYEKLSREQFNILSVHLPM